MLAKELVCIFMENVSMDKGGNLGGLHMPLSFEFFDTYGSL